MKKNKFITRIISLLLVICMVSTILPNDFVLAAGPGTDTSSSDGTENPGSVTVDTCTGGFMNEGECFYVSIYWEDMPNAESDSEALEIAKSHVVEDVKTGNRVYSGDAYGRFQIFHPAYSNKEIGWFVVDKSKTGDAKYQWYGDWEADSNRWSSSHQAASIIQDFCKEHIDGTFGGDSSKFKDTTNFNKFVEELVKYEKDCDWRTSFNEKWEKWKKFCADPDSFYYDKYPVVEFTLGVFVYRINPSKTYEFWRPSDICSKFSNWLNGYSSYDNFKSALIGSECTLSGKPILPCKIFFDGHGSGDSRHGSKVGAKCSHMFSKSAYVEDGSNRYYGRGYMLAVDAIKPVTPPKFSFAFGRTSPEKVDNDLKTPMLPSPGESVTANYTLYITPDEADYKATDYVKRLKTYYTSSESHHPKITINLSYVKNGEGIEDYVDSIKFAEKDGIKQVAQNILYKSGVENADVKASRTGSLSGTGGYTITLTFENTDAGLKQYADILGGTKPIKFAIDAKTPSTVAPELRTYIQASVTCNDKFIITENQTLECKPSKLNDKEANPAIVKNCSKEDDITTGYITSKWFGSKEPAFEFWVTESPGSDCELDDDITVAQNISDSFTIHFDASKEIIESLKALGSTTVTLTAKVTSNSKTSGFNSITLDDSSATFSSSVGSISVTGSGQNKNFIWTGKATDLASIIDGAKNGSLKIPYALKTKTYTSKKTLKHVIGVDVTVTYSGGSFECEPVTKTKCVNWNPTNKTSFNSFVGEFIDAPPIDITDSEDPDVTTYTFGVAVTPQDKNTGEGCLSGETYEDTFTLKMAATTKTATLITNDKDGEYSNQKYTVKITAVSSIPDEAAKSATYVSTTVSGLTPTVKKSGNKLNIEFKDISYANFKKLVIDKTPIKIKYSVKCNDYRYPLEPMDLEVIHNVAFTVSITDGHSGTDNNKHNNINGKASLGDSRFNVGDKSTYANWLGHLEQQVPKHETYEWTYQTNYVPKVYAEIVGNCVGAKTGTSDGLAADWNVSQGIPSTENVSVAVGGQSFLIDIGGYIHKLGSTTVSSTYFDDSNGNPNSALSSAPIERTITFEVKITNHWGDVNTPCSLSCSGSHSIASGGGSSSWSSGTSVTATTPNGTKVTETATCPGCDFVCPYCDYEYHHASHEVTAEATGENGIPAVYDSDGKLKPGTGTQDKPGTGTASCDANYSHNCTWSATYNCATGEISHSGGYDDWREESKSVTDSASGQAKDLTSASLGNSKEHVAASPVIGSLIDLGYTTGLGCACSGNTNMIHQTTKTRTFKLVEAVDWYAYREMTSAAVAGLCYAEVESVDANVIDANPANLSTSNANLKARVWHTNDYADKNGRVWFTQFKHPTYNGGWTDTSISATHWLGNCKITLTTIADTTIANTASPEALDTISGFSSNRGVTQGHYGGATSTATDYLNQTGDMMTTAETTNQALHVVNAWQSQNIDTYMCICISDALDVSVHNVAQNVLAECYPIDNGITLFNYGFTSNNETYYRNHHNRYDNPDLLVADMLAYKFWDSYDTLVDIRDPQIFGYGYTGDAVANPAIKYVQSGMYILYDETLISNLKNATTLKTMYAKNGEKWTANSWHSHTASCYSMNVNAITSNTQFGLPKGIGIAEGVLESITLTQTPQKFTGFYTTYDYPNIGTFQLGYKLNGVVQSLLPDQMTVITTNNAIGNLSSYVNSSDGSTINYSNYMVISNIPLKKTAQNGTYKSPIKVNGCYRYFFAYGLKSSCSECDGAIEHYKIRSEQEYSSSASKVAARFENGYPDGTLNDIVIHDPVSVQYCQVIGNGYGDYDGAGPAIDERYEDMRVQTAGMGEMEKPNYAVIGNTIHVWYTDFGDFYDAIGSQNGGEASDVLGVGYTGNGSNSETGASLAAAKGYTNNMCTAKWTDKRYVSFGFAVRYVDSSGASKCVPAHTWIDVATVQRCTDSGKVNSGGWHYGGATLQGVTSNDEEFKYGLDLEFTTLTSVMESHAEKVYFKSTAINAGNIDNEGSVVNKVRGANHKADHYAIGDETLEIVGRIGNLALEDVGDFRFATLFKKAKDSWLIEGVVKEVDSNNPVNIFATTYDIFGDVRESSDNFNKTTHSTLSITNYEYGGISGLGKAGKWSELPLSAANNSSPGFKTEQTRMGYTSYFDIETIGSYYGISIDDNGDTIEGPSSIEDESSPDGRNKTMTITPKYYLYDYSEDKFYAVDLYSGSKGNYTKFYSSMDAAMVQHSTDSSLMIDLPSEEGRRNVTQAEKDTTDYVLNKLGTTRAAYLASDYIGTPMKIVLDAADLDYIGSNIVRNSSDQISGAVAGEGTRADDFKAQSQRWYFTLAVPSSTIVAYPEAGTLSQTDIVNSADKLKQDHPNSVLMVFADITVSGNVFILRYDARTANGNHDTKITLFGDEGKPADWSSTYTNTVTINDEGSGGRKVYGPTGSVVETLSQKYAPLVIYNAFETSTTDKDTYGTH